jgi:hypothetical protein
VGEQDSGEETSGVIPDSLQTTQLVNAPVEVSAGRVAAEVSKGEGTPTNLEPKFRTPGLTLEPIEENSMEEESVTEKESSLEDDSDNTRGEETPVSTVEYGENYHLRDRATLKSTWDSEFLEGDGISDVSDEGGTRTVASRNQKECPYSFRISKKKTRRGGRKHKTKENRKDAEEVMVEAEMTGTQPITEQPVSLPEETPVVSAPATKPKKPGRRSMMKGYADLRTNPEWASVRAREIGLEEVQMIQDGIYPDISSTWRNS